MDEQMPVSQTSTPSLTLASLGWIIVAIVAAWFFLVAGPAAKKAGAQQGILDQNTRDKAAYEEALGSPVTSTPLANTINVRVVNMRPGVIVAQPLVFSTDNPFVEAPKQKLVLYDAQTRVVRRRVLPLAEYQRRVNAANHDGGNPMLIAPFDDMEASVSDIAPSDRLEVVARDEQALNNDSFMADYIAIVEEPTIPQPGT